VLLNREMRFERDFVRAGGLLLAAEDPSGNVGNLAGFGDQRELELLVEAGFTPLEAIHIATAPFISPPRTAPHFSENRIALARSRLLTESQDDAAPIAVARTLRENRSSSVGALGRHTLLLVVTMLPIVLLAKQLVEIN
jgi:hypothetical protein